MDAPPDPRTSDRDSCVQKRRRAVVQAKLGCALAAQRPYETCLATLAIVLSVIAVHRLIGSAPALDACPAAPALRAGAPSAAAGPLGAPAAVFSGIYASRAWGADGEGSGFGSTLKATAGLRLALEMLVHRHGVLHMVDAPCGSAHWVPPLLARVRRFAPCFSYAGVDVVASVVAENVAKVAGDARARFAVADLSAPDAELPRGADLLLCRDALQHLPFANAIGVLEAIARARPRLVAIGSYVTSAEANADIAVGEYYRINVLAAPFNLTAPLDEIDELSPKGSDRKFLLLFTGEYIASLDFAAMRERAAAARAAAPFIVVKDGVAVARAKRPIAGADGDVGARGAGARGGARAHAPAR
jgi:hypothetical protein